MATRFDPDMNDKNDTIAKIMIDDQERLLIFPAANTYPMIYREAVEVHWDPSGKYLYSPKPREWTYLDWFKHIVTTVDNTVHLSPETEWENVPDDLRRDAESWMKETEDRTSH